MSNPPSPVASPDLFQFDVTVIGGALAGAATALVLRREHPELKVLVIEKSSHLGRRVGEASVEVSGYFLSRVLGLTQHLNESHLVKQGMRFWFYNEHCRSLAECGEVGGKYLARVPAYQIDRSVLDEEVLRRAAQAGSVVWRPASVQSVRLQPGGWQEVEVAPTAAADSANGAPRNGALVRSRWVVDASGVAALLARQNGWLTPNDAHPTCAAWARWTGVKDWDGLELARRYPAWADACFGIRCTATNHIVGPGWWAWFIPLKGGDTSIGVVFDQRLAEWPSQGTLGERLRTFLTRHPVARELLAEATIREGDVHWRKNLPYWSKVMAGDGFVLVGDAAAFLDPFYSPGMDWISYTVSGAVRLIASERRGEAMPSLIEQHNRVYTGSYNRWFQAIYQDKYEYMGDFELMRLAFLFDLGLYYLGVASQPFKRGLKALTEPVFSTPASRPFFHFMRAYNRRFARIARVRRARGQWGKANHGRRFLFGGFTFAPTSAGLLLKALAGWLWLEVTEGWRSWGRRGGAANRTAANIVPAATKGSLAAATGLSPTATAGQGSHPR